MRALAVREARRPAPHSGRGARPTPTLALPPGPGLGNRAWAEWEPRDERLRWVRSGRREGPGGALGSAQGTDAASRWEETVQIEEPGSRPA